MYQKKDKRETDQDKHQEEVLDIAIYLSISPHYDLALISHYCCHSTQTKLLSSLFVMYAMMHISTNFGNIYNRDSYYKLETKI